ncbi:CHAT domain-containing protein [Methanothrix sp.]|uniref:CHAT domain-containing protein n=1 Tax=Methanothrix sp. TaxID=90426 RepID=UPI003C77BBE9
MQAIEEDLTQEEHLKRLGSILFDALFDKKISNQFAALKAEAENMGRGIRLRLIFENPEIAALPWEFLYEESTNTFLANDPKTALSRYIDVPLRRQEIKPASLPLKMLLVISSPSDLDPLDSEGEEGLIRKALEKHISSGLIQIDTISKATIDAIYQKMNEKAYNVFHFIGHGVFGNNKGHVALVDEDGRASLLDDEAFANLFLGRRGLGLVILNSCEGAMTSSGQVFRGMAPCLVQRGIPAVVAMQYTILDSTAKIFAEEFYRSLARGEPVDRAVQSARNLISIKVKLDNRGFATPVLFMRAKDGLILNLQEIIQPSVLSQPQKPDGTEKNIEKNIGRDAEKDRKEVEKEAGTPFYKRYEKIILAVSLMIVIAVALIYLLSPDDIQISGTVRDWSGNPIENVDVKALPASVSIRTDSNGHFILSSISSKNVDRLQIKKDVTNEIIEIPISSNDKKNKSIVINNIVFRPIAIRLYGDIRDYVGDSSGAAARITIKSGNNYLINLTDIEFGKYDTNVYSNATTITAYDTNGEIIYTSPLRFTDNEIQQREKKLSIRFPSKTEIDIAGKVFNIYDKEALALANATVKIGPASDRTNDSGYYNLYGVPRSSQYYQVSKEGQIIVTKNLSDRHIDWTEPNWIYYLNASLNIQIPRDNGE